jgi:hypothetical protein
MNSSGFISLLRRPIFRRPLVRVEIIRKREFWYLVRQRHGDIYFVMPFLKTCAITNFRVNGAELENFIVEVGEKD